MSSPRANKLKGYRFEFDIVERIIAKLGHVYDDVKEKVNRNGNRYGGSDRGDVASPLPFVIECKNEQRLDLSGWQRETEKERQNANEPFGVNVIKARGKSIDESYTVMPFSQWLDLAYLLHAFVPEEVLDAFRPSNAQAARLAEIEADILEKTAEARAFIEAGEASA